MFNLNNLKIRNKLAVILVLPLLALLVFASVGFKQRNSVADRSDHDLSIITLAQDTSSLLVAAQQEGILSVATVSGKDPANRPDPNFAVQLETARAKFDVAAKKVLTQAKSINFKSPGLDGVQTKIESISTTRSNVTTKDNISAWPVVFDRYNVIVNNILTLFNDVSRATDTPEVVLPLADVDNYLTFVSYKSAADSLAVGIYNSGTTRAATGASSSEDSATRFKTQTENAASAANQAGEFTNSATYSSVNNGDALPSILAKINNDLPVVLLSATGAVTFASDSAPIQEVVDDALRLAKDRAAVATTSKLDHSLASTYDATSARHADAVRAQQLFVLFAGLVLVIAIVLAIWVARSITLRIRTLTLAADKLANEQLPRLVDSLKNPAEDDVGYLTSSFTELSVGGTDEIGRLSGAFNRIQGVAVDVATEQAQLLRKGIGDMFVNLARRNQGLLDRQIEFIDQLESTEEDPDQLENLFRLDHLATRMRRNAESLLVLAGAEPNRRRGKPVPLADVVRAAVGEVEDFARIDMLQFDQVLVASNAALDIAHLLSELMENAANFSPPDSRVEVVGHRTKAEGYVISVADHGIGMTPEQITDANDLLARPPLVGLALSRSLGFIVIGRLASRFGIAVRLMPSPSGGTTAMVSLPPALITDQPRNAGGPGAITSTAEQPPSAPRSTAHTTRHLSAPDEAEPTATPTLPERAPQARQAKPEPAGGAAPERAPLSRRGSPAPTPTPPQPMPQRSQPQSTPAEPAPASAETAAPTQDGSLTAPTEATSKSASGLTKRVPRSSGGKRAVPGGDSERAATKNRRSPEEVRSMLSRYQSGVARGRSEDTGTDTPEGNQP